MSQVVRTLIVIMGFLPLSVARALGATIGQLAWLVKSRSALTTRANLRACYPGLPESEREMLAARSMRNWGMTLCEIPVIWHKGHKSLEFIRTIHGEEILDKAIERGKGVIMVSPHHGNWEQMGYWAATKGQLTALYQPPRRFKLDQLLHDVRTKTGTALVPTNLRGVSKLAKALRRGELIGVLPDMVPDKSRGVYAPFFGQQAMTMTLVHSLQQKTDAFVVVCVAQRVKGGFEIFISEADEGIKEEDPVLSVTALNNTVESMVSLAPEQYQWEYKRFKRGPEGAPKIY